VEFDISFPLLRPTQLLGSDKTEELLSDPDLFTSHPRFVGAMKLLPSPPETWTREYKVYFSRRFLATPLLARILTEEILWKEEDYC
jgi:hypothetical protein